MKKVDSTTSRNHKDCEMLDMVWVKRLELLLIYCHSTLQDKLLSKKSKIIGFNFKKPSPSASVYLSSF